MERAEEDADPLSSGADDRNQKEVRGRLHVWTCALLECEVLLRDALRAKAAMSPLPPAQEFFDHETAAFGTWVDLYHVHASYLSLAAVYFCQLFNKGFRDEGVAAANIGDNIGAERETILSKAFPHAIERNAFERLLDRVRDARDSVIAHADGGKFRIEHTETVIVSEAFAEAVKDLDAKAWRDAVKRISAAISERQRELNLQASIVYRTGPGHR